MRYLKLVIIGLIVFGAIAFAIVGGSPDKLAELENNLTASGYGWLVNYSGDLYG